MKIILIVEDLQGKETSAIWLNRSRPMEWGRNDLSYKAVTSNIAAQGYYELIPELPMQNETGLLMQMVIPCFEDNF